MQENSQAPRRGRARLVEHERGVLAAFAKVRTLPVDRFLVDGDHVVIHWVFEFTRLDGKVLRFDELALQRWRGDRITEERFFYDPPR
jgi:ketosteroid isomerase-like protein